jgi:diguanylate cyclase (GGDEF)-like protein
MMIDLDSFKLINDLYGHNMGDKILAQFADILKGEIRASDIAGRIGGDEFIVFCSNITDISVIEQKCRRINLQLLTYARNILGDNFNVPLGASMGAVKAPEEGRDFLTLYQKADNALYQAKQAGAHGCVFYNKTIGGTAESAPDEHNATLQILRERGPADSALILPFEQFRLMYQVLARLASNYTTENYLLAFTVSLRSDCVDADEVMECFCKNVSHSLRSSDIVTRHGSLSAMVLLLRTDQIDSRSVAERIMRKWNDCGHGADCELSYEIDPIQ